MAYEDRNTFMLVMALRRVNSEPHTAFDIPATYLTGGIFRLFFEIFKLNEA